MNASAWIIIVNFRTADLAVDCLRSLSTQVGGLAGGRVIVADNATGDTSVERLEAAIAGEGWSDWAGALALARNGGFAYCNNAGIRAALRAARPPDYVLLLNPDTVARPGAIRALVVFMEAHPDVGIANSRLENSAGEGGCSTNHMPSPLAELNRSACLDMISRRLNRYVTYLPICSKCRS